METSAIRTTPLAISVIVKDVMLASSQLETILGQAGAQNIHKESQQGKEVVTAELKAQSVPEFLEKLKPIGEIKEKVVFPEAAEGNITIRVDLSSNP
jgi:hypothetical protein